MAKRKASPSSGDEDETTTSRVAESESPERPLQTARPTGKKAKVEAQYGYGGNNSEEGAPNEMLKSVRPPKASSSKSTKAASVKKPKVKSNDKSEADLGDGDVTVAVNGAGERYVELSKKRRATVNSFKGTRCLDIREFYGDEDNLKPGKKGISLTEEQWEALKKSSRVIDSLFAKLKK